MSNMDNQNNTPDSWDQNEEQGAGDKDISNQMSQIKLNAEAPSFVPGQNVYAAAFVPSSYLSNSDTPNKVTDQKMDTEPTQTTQEDIPPDDWAENGGEEGGGSSEEQMDSEESEAAPAVQVKSKSKKNIEIGPPPTKKEHINVVFIGHVDAGKSTIGGQLMYLTGMVDKRTLEKYEREAKEKNRESWYLSWALDTNQEERDKGKTVEVGRAFFETENRHFTILDAPGHRSFVPNMIGGASQADLAVLVISARKGEFETGYERGGQTREHAMLAKTAGIKALVVLVNKMDDPTVEWAESRYNEIKEKLTPYLRKCGFNPKTDVYYIPCSGLTGANLKDLKTDVCPWFSGKPFIKYLNELPNMSREAEGPVRVPLVDRYKDMGVMVLGKVESGRLTKNQSLMLMPNKQTVEIMQLWSDDVETELANPGENVKIKLKNVEEEDVSPGFVLCSADGLCNTGKIFDAQIVILEHKSIICAGYSAILHIHNAAEEVSIKALICTVDKKTGEKSKTRPRFVKQDQIAIARLEVAGGIICLEPFKQFPQMGRFTLRDEGKTIAIGKVLKIIE